MNTLNEIRFDDKDLFFNDNIVKTSILPQGTKDLKRNIKVQANSVFEGSVFGNNVEIEDGGVIFKGAVFAIRYGKIQQGRCRCAKHSGSCGEGQGAFLLRCQRTDRKA